MHPSLAQRLSFSASGLGSLLLMGVIGTGLEWGGVRTGAGIRFLSSGTVTCGQVVPRGAWVALSGFRGRDLLTQAAIKSPISAWWPPPSLWTSDYFCNSHNLNPLLWPDPFNLSSPPCLCSSFSRWHTDFTQQLSFLLAQEIPQFLQSFQYKHRVPLTPSSFFTPGFSAKPCILVSLMELQD